MSKQISKTQIISLANQGKSLAETAEILGIGKQTLNKLIKDNNIQVEFKSRRSRYTLVDDDIPTNTIEESPIIPSNITNTEVPVNQEF